MSYYYTPWKRQKAVGFLKFSGGIEMGHWSEKGKPFHAIGLFLYPPEN